MFTLVVDPGRFWPDKTATVKGPHRIGGEVCNTIPIQHCCHLMTLHSRCSSSRFTLGWHFACGCCPMSISSGQTLPLFNRARIIPSRNVTDEVCSSRFKMVSVLTQHALADARGVFHVIQSSRKLIKSTKLILSKFLCHISCAALVWIGHCYIRMGKMEQNQRCEVLFICDKVI